MARVEHLILSAILGAIVIAAATVVAPRVRVAAPLVLVVVGIGVSFLPFVPTIEVDPEIILVGVLPPLLYSAAVNLPAVEFRRDAKAVGGLAVALVLLTTTVLGVFFYLAIPELNFFLALALGAILSPTDAVATAIAKRLGLSRRVIVLLDGESLLNDATALVTLRTAIAAAAAGAFALGQFVGDFALAVFLAVVVGAIVGWVGIRARQLIPDSAANSVLGFVVPFAAYLPTEHLGGSGLVAAVVAGIVTGQGAARRLTAEQRLTDQTNWHTIERVLEGAVFLIMGLEVKDLWQANIEEQDGPFRGFVLAIIALLLVLVVRTAYVSVLIPILNRRRAPERRTRLTRISSRLDGLDDEVRDAHPQRLRGIRARINRAFADLDYYQAKPLTWRHGGVIVWAGMRGVVTLAAAQTLPRDTPSRELLVFTAFLVALFSLLIQGLTLSAVARALKVPPDDEDYRRDEHQRLTAELRSAASEAIANNSLRRSDGTAFDDRVLAKGARMAEAPSDDLLSLRDDLAELRLALIGVMRKRLLELGRDGYSSTELRRSLAALDAEELSLRTVLDEGE